MQMTNPNLTDDLDIDAVDTGSPSCAPSAASSDGEPLRDRCGNIGGPPARLRGGAGEDQIGACSIPGLSGPHLPVGVPLLARGCSSGKVGASLHEWADTLPPRLARLQLEKCGNQAARLLIIIMGELC